MDKAWFITEWKASNNYIYFPAAGSGYTIKYVEIDNTGAVVGTWHTISNASSNHYINQHIQAGKRYRIQAFGGSFRQIYFYSYSGSRSDMGYYRLEHVQLCVLQLPQSRRNGYR